MFSIFANHSQNKPLENITLTELYRQLIQPDREPYLSTVNMIERLRAATDPKTEKHIKGGLLCFTPAGVVETKKADATPAQRNMKLSGFMQIDIDLQDNPNMKDAAVVRDQLAGVPYIALAAISARGRGVWGLLALEEPEKFTQYADQVYDYFKRARVTLDKSKGKALTELRYFAPDSGAILNDNFKLFPLVAVKPKVADKAGHRATGSSLSELREWVTVTTGFNLVEGQIHNYLLWLSYALRKNGATEPDVYNAIYSIISRDEIRTNCVSGGISIANNKGMYTPTEHQSKPTHSRSQYSAKLPASVTNPKQYVPLAAARDERRTCIGIDEKLFINYPGLPQLIS